MPDQRILILGGTSEAMELARALARKPEIVAVMSLAGRTGHPILPPIAYRIGGFGGVDGLIAYLKENSITAVIDATHPFAAQMSRHAAAACDTLRVPRLVFTRPAWSPCDEDRWISAVDTEFAVDALGEIPRRIFLTVGRLSLPAFRRAPQHLYLVRSIDGPDEADCPPHMKLHLARGPFDINAERLLMAENSIEIIVTKNSGGKATDAKLRAARGLGLQVIMIERPAIPESRLVYDLAEVLEFIDTHNVTP